MATDDHETPANITLYKKKKEQYLVNEEGFVKALAFEPSSSDVIIVTAQKSGSTWMQQIVHQLRTGGDDSFEDIIQKVPILEHAHRLDQDLQADQANFPRCFKTFSWTGPKNSGKYIFLFRHPYSAAYSFYKWDQTLGLFGNKEISVEEYVRHCWSEGRYNNTLKMHSLTYFDLASSWIKHRTNPNVLFVFYEDLVQHRERELKRIARFMKVYTDDKIRGALDKTSFEYMKAHPTPFSATILKRACGVGVVDTAASKVRKGSTTEGKESLSVEARKFIDLKWKETVQPTTGFASYEELHTAMSISSNV